MPESSSDPIISDEEFELAAEAAEEIKADITIDFLDIELPDSLTFQPSQWLDDRYDVVRDNGVIYEGRVRNGKKHGEGTLFDENRTQHVRGYWHDDELVLVHFAEFLQPNENDDLFRIYGRDNLMTCDKHNFVARIEIQALSTSYLHFPTLRKYIHGKITIIKILDDSLKNELYNSRTRFEKVLNSSKNCITISRSAQRDMFQLFLIMGEMKKLFDYENENENINLLEKISNNNSISVELRDEARKTSIYEKTVFSRNKKLPIMKLTDFEFSWKNIVIESVKESIINIKKSIILSLPTRLYIHTGPEDIDNLKERQLFTCSVHDIQLFKDLELSAQHSLNLQNFSKDYIYELWKLLIKKVNNNSLSDIPNDSVYTRTVFLQLFKTFLELLNSDLELREKIEINKYNIDLEIIETDYLGPTEERLNFVIQLLNHFKPGDIKEYKFNYTFEFFNTQEPQNIFYSAINGITNYVKRKFDSLITNISEEYLIWLYYIHFSFAQLNKAESNNKIELNSFLNSLMDLFKNVIKNNDISLEKVRILSNSIIKFGITICPYFLSQSSIYVEDMEILQKQADYIKDFVTANDHCLDEITSIVDIYQVFWDERQYLDDLITKSIAKTSREILISTLNSFTKNAFDLQVFNNNFLIFLRSFNEFIRLLRGTKFPWFVKASNLLTEDFVELVDKDNNSFLVKETEKFLEEYGNSNLPRHYLFDTAINFIGCAEKFLANCKWDSKILAASDLLLLMGRSLINLQKLPNAVDFDKFFSDFTEPFRRVTVNSSDFSDFKQRLGSLENYYRYTIQLNVMGIENALSLCRSLNSNDSSSSIDYSFENDVLKECFEVYLTKFNTYVDEYILKDNFKTKKLVDKVKSKAKNINFKKWDYDFKREKLPKLLAGLSAIWSALESKDIISQKKVMKPHVIQILCILRLLGVDQRKDGFDSHLAQVLTGQGKSIILGLLSALIALTGNRVRVVCYNKYLADRDQNDFKNFFKELKIENDINYGTFDNMANEITEPKFKGVNYDLRKFVRELITGELNTMYVKEEEKATSRTVLLIDEVDVFFTPEFYGNTYNPCTTIGSENIADLQLKIWNLTSTTCNKSDLRENIMKYIDEIFPTSTDPIFISVVRNSRTFLNKMVEEMISNAVDVRCSTPGDWYDKKYKLNQNDNIIVVEDNGEYKNNTYYRYKNAFMYFKLKKNDFKHNAFNNYGYLNVNCGSVSYAMLPKDYSSILGVTGTLKQLSKVETRAVESYGISRGSSMPTFFGTNKLRVTNFTIKSTEDYWSTAILDSILSIVEKGRAVIVFFENEHIIAMVKEKFASHLSRYSVLTGNESDEEVATCVQEAGVAKKVTIATRRMGRGVDFQSNDSAVESKGGVHIIQTFFSDDIKEETQIKGRTARKDNSGTYEAILCQEHLTKANYSDSLNSYEKLNSARIEKAETIGDELAKNIEKSEKKHNSTMEFLRSFYNYKICNRNEYFQKYPFIDLD